MKMTLAMAGVLTATLPLKADIQPFVDYDRLLQTHSSEMVMTKDADGATIRELPLGDGLLVKCMGISGTDCASSGVRIGEGDVGCLLAGVAPLKRKLDHCDGRGTQDQRRLVSTLFHDLIGFVAVNSLPPRIPSELAEEVVQTRDRVLDKLGDPCRHSAESLQAMLRSAADPEMIEYVRQLVSVPSLPLTWCGALLDPMLE